MIYTIFEDNTARNLYPFTLNHAVVEIRYGAFTIIERFQNLLNDDDKIIFAMKKGIKLTVKGESSLGTKTTDTYTLKGFTAGYNQLFNDC